MRTIVKVEPLILMAAIFFYWYPSNFPAQTAATGIDASEWRWLFVMCVLMGVLLAGYALLYVPHISMSRRVVGLLACAAVTILLLLIGLPDGLPVDRADWFWLLALLFPVMLARYALHGRLWTLTLYEVWFIFFIFLCILSVEVAPYPSRGLRMLMRPLLGMAIVLAFTEVARTQKTMRPLLLTMILFALLLTALALGGTQWTAKSEDFRAIIDALPNFEPFFARGGFNPNEIAGAIAWFIPLMGGLVFWKWPSRVDHIWRGLAGVAFLGLMLALVLGQSRFAILGVIVALTLIAIVVIPSPWRYLALGGVALAVIIQAVILFNLLPGNGDGSGSGASVGLSARDTGTSSQRLDIWDAAADLISTHPVTGVGMNRWRYGPVATAFPVVGYDIPDPDQPDLFRQFRLPHTHNELIQVTTDLGIPGAVFFIGLHLTCVFMLWISWKHGTQPERLLVASIAGGLIAHAGYGIGDAIPLWDRFSFILWMLLGMASAQYVLTQQRLQINQSPRTTPSPPASSPT